ncbi:hypothetical protein Q5N45_17990 [Vibrio cholerae]|nr:hypothetical protein [Vibrio cholerae]MDV2340919.1 hypothetical protein [Vibrio cholerae]
MKKASIPSQQDYYAASRKIKPNPSSTANRRAIESYEERRKMRELFDYLH